MIELLCFKGLVKMAGLGPGGLTYRMNWHDIFLNDGKIPTDKGNVFLDIHMLDIPETLVNAFKVLREQHPQVRGVSMIIDPQVMTLEIDKNEK